MTSSSKPRKGRAWARQQVHRWFESRGWTPFPFQKRAWEAYLKGRSGLIHASTGTGKTYAVWMGPLIEALAGGRSQPENQSRLTVLWITPLRALASDITDSLRQPVRDLEVGWTLESRTGDTSQRVRARQRVQLPTALVTTPESLSILLSHPGAAENLRDLKLVVVDEWHELLSTKRGVQTELCLARLRTFCPGLRVWGLSATMGNLPIARQALLGVEDGHRSLGETRVIRGSVPKRTIIESLIPRRMERFPWSGHIGLRMLDQVVERVDAAQTSLLFANTRGLAETWYQAILEARPDWAGQIAIHHGSLDREVREWVEDRLRGGGLKCVVCTSSLDLGVDFSPVEQVIQIGSSKGVARLLQRAGRSGHQPAGISRVTCVPTNALELIEVAAVRVAAKGGRIEERIPLSRPLDVLAQHMTTIASGDGFRANEMFEEVTSTYSYRDLQRKEFDWALEFVAFGGRVLERYPEYSKVQSDGKTFRIKDTRTAQRHRMMIGTISSDASVIVKYLGGGRLGSVEESFAARLRPGDSFVFAGKVLEFVRMREMTVEVRRAQGRSNSIPRWTGGRMPLSSELASEIREMLTKARSGEFRGKEMRALRPVLEIQSQWSQIPSSEEFLVECIESGEGSHLFFFPFEGRVVNEGIAAVIAYRLSMLKPLSFSISANDYGFELLSPEPAPLEQALDQNLFRLEGLLSDISNSLNAAELAKRQFRDIARVAGLTFTGFPGQRKTSRQLQTSAGLLFDVFRRYDPENLLIFQAEREVLEGQLDSSRLARTLERIQKSRLVMVRPKRWTPLAFPLMVDRLRTQVSSEDLTARILRIVAQLETEADRTATGKG